MTLQLLYSTKNNTTFKIVSYIKTKLKFSRYNIICNNVNSLKTGIFFAESDVLFFCVPTYGCEELHSDFEFFLCKDLLPKDKRKYIIIETGNYYGYDDFTFGSKKILMSFLSKYDYTPYCQFLSLDTYPKIDWDQLDRWLEYICQIE